MAGGELDYEVKRTDRGDACQIYHLNLLKRWNEGTLVGLAAVVLNEDDLGPEAALKHNPLALVSGGDHLSPRQLTDLAQLQADFADVFSPLPGRTDLVQHHIETLPGEVARSHLLSPSRTQDKCSSGRVKGHAKLGSNRRIA